MAKIHEVVAGDTLSNLAESYYGDATRSLLIAVANRIDEPFDLPIGEILVIPDVVPEGANGLWSAPGLPPSRPLPYASELFGMYQPLIGWRSRLQIEELAAGLARRFENATSHLRNVTEVNRESPVPDVLRTMMTDRTGSRIGRAIVTHAGSQSLDAEGWQRMLVGDDAPLISLTGELLSDVDPKRRPGAELSREVAAAGLLRHLAENSPRALELLFEHSMQPWERSAAAIEFLSAQHPAQDIFLSPIGILHRFREYFFELGSFLGPPVGHVWLSPGGTVELVEVNTRRTLVEESSEQSVQTVQKTELNEGGQDELSDAVKVENMNDVKLGATATASGGVASVFQASGSASFNLDTSRKQAQEQTHKHMREQSSKLSSEVRQDFKTTFRTVSETTDTSSRRYVLQNTTNRLVSYELSRKMRKVAVQVQDLGQQLCWQLYVDNPGDPLGIGEFVHEAAAAAAAGIKEPDVKPTPQDQDKTHQLAVPFILIHGADDEAENTYTTSPDHGGHGIFVPDVGADDIIQFDHTFTLEAPPAGTVLDKVRTIDFHGAKVEFRTTHPTWKDPNPNPNNNTFRLLLTYANFEGKPNIPFEATFIYKPTPAAIAAVEAANDKSQKAYDDEVAVKKEQLFFTTLRKRLKLSGQVTPRNAEYLREEERSVIYRKVVSRLYGKQESWASDDFHVTSELIRYFFDIESMLYFVAPDWWRPRTQKLVPVTKAGEFQPTTIVEPKAVALGKVKLGSSATEATGHRPYYLITEETAPAPLGASLGWLIQLDGDVNRNAFLNSPWVKVVLPIRPGRERDAIAWLRRPEVAGSDGLNEPYPFDENQDPPEYLGLTMEQVLLKIAGKIAKDQADSLTPVPVEPSDVNSKAALPAEMVFSRGFDPLAGGVEFGSKPFSVFSEWTEILPTDQVVATEYRLEGL